jgi:hypothetical protein
MRTLILNYSLELALSMRKIREFFSQANRNLLGTAHSADTGSEVFAATVFYKILLGRQPRLVIQVHRR